MIKMIDETDRELYKKIYRKSSNTELLNDYRGMKSGKYVTWGQGELRKEIDRRKEEGLMRKSTSLSNKPKRERKAYEMRFGGF